MSFQDVRLREPCKARRSFERRVIRWEARESQFMQDMNAHIRKNPDGIRQVIRMLMKDLPPTESKTKLLWHFRMLLAEAERK